MTALESILKHLPDETTIDEEYALLKKEADEIAAHMLRIKAIIVENFIEDPESIHAVSVIPTKARKTVAWAQVAKEAKVSKIIIDKHTKIGEPGFTIKQLTNEEPGTPSKFISA